MHKQCDVLILTAKFGSGHMSASEAIKEHIHAGDKDLDVRVLDFYEVTNPFLYKSMYKGYEMLVKKGYHLYNRYYYKKNDSETIRLMEGVSAVSLERLNRLMAQLKPKVVVSTFPVCASYVAAYKSSYDTELKTITCITDVLDHDEWIYSGTDMYFVASEDVKQRLVGKGIKRESIIITGIPVRKTFTERKSRMDLRCLYGYKHRDRLILMMGGGLGLLPEDVTFYKDMLLMDESVKLIVVTGNNTTLYKKLTRLRLPRLKVLRFTHKVSDYMSMSDILVGKAGGITLFESIACKIPMIVFKPVLGHEIHNCEFIETEGIGVVTREYEELKQQVRKLLYNSKYRAKLRTELERLGETVAFSYTGTKVLHLIK